MEIILKGYLIKSIDSTEEILIKVNEVNAKLVRKKLESEHDKIISLFKQLKESGAIKSVYIPKNRKLQKEIDKLTTIKKEIKNSISKIKTLFK